jgi:hypothetical protein
MPGVTHLPKRRFVALPPTIQHGSPASEKLRLPPPAAELIVNSTFVEELLPKMNELPLKFRAPVPVLTEMSGGLPFD